MAWTIRESKSRSWAWCGRGKHSRRRVEVNGGADIGCEWKVVEIGAEGAIESDINELDVDRVCVDGRMGPGLGMSH